MLSRIVTGNLAKVVFTGGFPLSDKRSEPTSFTIGTSFFDSMRDSEWALAKKRENPKVNLTEYPGTFPRKGTEMSWAHELVYSYRLSKEKKPMEFEMINPSNVFPYYPSTSDVESDSSIFSFLANGVIPLFDKCASFEVLITDKCNKISSGKKKELYGFPCNNENGKFDETKCVLGGCKNGYFLLNGKCNVIPDEYYYSYSLLLSIAISLSSLMIIIIVSTTIFIISWKKKHNKYLPIPGKEMESNIKINY